MKTLLSLKFQFLSSQRRYNTEFLEEHNEFLEEHNEFWEFNILFLEKHILFLEKDILFLEFVILFLEFNILFLEKNMELQKERTEWLLYPPMTLPNSIFAAPKRTLSCRIPINSLSI